jgi:hypothetical protein
VTLLAWYCERMVLFVLALFDLFPALSTTKRFQIRCLRIKTISLLLSFTWLTKFPSTKQCSCLVLTIARSRDLFDRVLNPCSDPMPHIQDYPVR